MSSGGSPLHPKTVPTQQLQQLFQQALQATSMIVLGQTISLGLLLIPTIKSL